MELKLEASIIPLIGVSVLLVVVVIVLVAVIYKKVTKIEKQMDTNSLLDNLTFSKNENSGADDKLIETNNLRGIQEESDDEDEYEDGEEEEVEEIEEVEK